MSRTRQAGGWSGERAEERGRGGLLAEALGGPADRFWVSGLESWWAWPDWRGVRDALHKTADLKRSATSVTREQVHDVIAGEYGWDEVVFGQWAPVLEEVSRVVGEGRHHVGASGPNEPGLGKVAR